MKRGFWCSSTGGDAVQSVAILTPRTMPSRAAPRKPGQAAGGSSFGTAGSAGVRSGTTGSGEGFSVDVRGAAGAVVVGMADGSTVGAGAGGSDAGTSSRCASSRSSGVGAQRHARSCLPAPENPPVRTSPQNPQPITTPVWGDTSNIAHLLVPFEFTKILPQPRW